jgi:phosphohistidine phosphatase
VQLLIVRHAIAVEPAPGLADEERPLTEEGEKRFREAARGLAAVLDPPDVLLTSPWLRALQTAEIAASAWGKVTPKPTTALAGGRFEDLAKVLHGYRGKKLVAVVGHEPWLSELLARLLASSDASRFAFKKGGAALVDLPGELGEGGSLVWSLPPRMLRALGDGAGS